MASACYTDLKKKDVNKRVFARPSEGHFGLREWANDAELAHLLQPKLHRLAETFDDTEKKVKKVEKPWKQPAPIVKKHGGKKEMGARKYVDEKPRRDRYGFVHAIIESEADDGPPRLQMPPSAMASQKNGSNSTEDRMDLDALVDAAANQEEEEEEDNVTQSYDTDNDDAEGANAGKNMNSANDAKTEKETIATLRKQGETDKEILAEFPLLRHELANKDEPAALVLTNPNPNLSDDEYKAHLSRLVQQQQEKEMRVAKRKEREKERQRTQELIKAGLIEPPQSARRKTSYVPVAYKRDRRGRPRKNFDELPPAPILSVPTNAAQEAPLTNNKKNRFTSANTTLDYHQQQQQQGVKSHARAGHVSFEVDTQGVDGISYEDIENERVVAKATRAGMKNWNSKVNTSYSTSLFSEIIDPKLPTNIPAFAFKMSVNDAEREKVLTQIAMRRVFNEFAQGCDPVKQSLNELSASLERLRAQQGNHENVMYSALIYAVACYRSDYPEEATLALSNAWDVYFSLKGGNETKAQDAAFMDKIKKDYEKIVSEALDSQPTQY